MQGWQTVAFKIDWARGSMMRHSTAGLLKVRLVVEFILCFVRVGAGLQQLTCPGQLAWKDTHSLGSVVPWFYIMTPCKGYSLPQLQCDFLTYIKTNNTTSSARGRTFLLSHFTLHELQVGLGIPGRLCCVLAAHPALQITRLSDLHSDHWRGKSLLQHKTTQFCTSKPLFFKCLISPRLAPCFLEEDLCLGYIACLTRFNLSQKWLKRRRFSGLTAWHWSLDRFAALGDDKPAPSKCTHAPIK